MLYNSTELYEIFVNGTNNAIATFFNIDDAFNYARKGNDLIVVYRDWL